MADANEEPDFLIENPFFKEDEDASSQLNRDPMQLYECVPGPPDPLPEAPPKLKRVVRRIKCTECSGSCFQTDSFVPDMGESLAYALYKVDSKNRKREGKFWAYIGKQNKQILGLQSRVAELEKKLTEAKLELKKQKARDDQYCEIIPPKRKIWNQFLWL